MSSLQVPSNVSSITISSVPYTPVNNVVTGVADADATLLCDAYNRPSLVSTSISNGNGTVRFPLNVSAITVSSTVYNPDASGYIYNVPATDTTLLIDAINGFSLVQG